MADEAGDNYNENITHHISRLDQPDEIIRGMVGWGEEHWTPLGIVDRNEEELAAEFAELPPAIRGLANSCQLNFRAKLTEGGNGVITIFDFTARDGTVHTLVLKYSLEDNEEYAKASRKEEGGWFRLFKNLKHSTKEIPFNWVMRRMEGWDSVWDEVPHDDNPWVLDVMKAWPHMILMPFYSMGSLGNMICRLNGKEESNKTIFPTGRMYWQVFTCRKFIPLLV